MALRPETATVWRGEWRSVGIDEVLRGDRLRVLVGERVPVDGKITSGESELDESILTGESLPVPRAGDAVLGGAINRSGVLGDRGHDRGEDPASARSSPWWRAPRWGKAPLQQLVDRVSAVFVPVVMAIALFTLLAWYAASNDFGQALLAAVAVLVIACPCALGLATPAAIVTGTGWRRATASLIKDVDTCRRPTPSRPSSSTRQGLLTQGQPVLASWSGSDEQLRLAAALQQASEHPLALAMRGRPAKMPRCPAGGGGGAGRCRHPRSGGGPRGRHRQQCLLAQLGIEAPAQEEQPADGATRVWVAIDGVVVGLAALADTLRPESPRGHRHPAPARHRQLAGERRRARACIPHRRQTGAGRGLRFRAARRQRWTRWRRCGRKPPGWWPWWGRGERCAGARRGGTWDRHGLRPDVAMETAAITLMRSDPRLVADAIDISAATWRTIQQNLFWAFVFNVVGIPLAALGYLSPELAGGQRRSAASPY